MASKHCNSARTPGSVRRLPGKRRRSVFNALFPFPPPLPPAFPLPSLPHCLVAVHSSSGTSAVHVLWALAEVILSHHMGLASSSGRQGLYYNIGSWMNDMHVRQSGSGSSRFQCPSCKRRTSSEAIECNPYTVRRTYHICNLQGCRPTRHQGTDRGCQLLTVVDGWWRLVQAPR